MLMTLLILFGVFVLCTVLHIGSMAGIGWLIGAPIERVSLFFGPLIHSIRIRNVSFDIRAYPLGGFVKFTEDSFKTIHPIRRTFVAASGCISLLLVSLGILGLAQGFERFANGFYQLFAGALFPRSVGSRLLLNLYYLTARGHLIATVGVVAGKMAAVNLLPLPTLNGGEILGLLIEAIKPVPESIRGRLHLIGFLIFLPIVLLWLVALLFFGRTLFAGG